MAQCADNFSFFVETFGWIIEPRAELGKSPILPFIFWPSQRKFIEVLHRCAGKRDLLVGKARGEGVSWTIVYYMVWLWLFSKDIRLMGMVSRSMDICDSPGDADTLGFKIDWLLERLPKWMAGKKDVHFLRNISKHYWVNLGTGSSITAYPATGDLGSGGRKFLILLDEAAKFARGQDEDAMEASEPASDSRVIVSTFSGVDNAYYRMMRMEDSNAEKFYFNWYENPSRNENLFCIDERTRQLVDPKTKTQVSFQAYQETFFQDDYPRLVKRGYDTMSPDKLWSPWLVSRCLRPRMTPRSISQEYLQDPGGSGGQYFHEPLISGLLKSARPPLIQGIINIDPDKLTVVGFVRNMAGSLRLWIPIDKRTGPPRGNFVVGCDTAAGHGGDQSSNSVAVVVNRDTGVKVGEWVSQTTSPADFAEIAIALCRWFQTPDGMPAHLIWENGGPGDSFRERVTDTNFTNFYWSRTHGSANRKRTKKPGFNTTNKSKRALLEKYHWALAEGLFDNPSEMALRETLYYVFGPNNKIVFTSPMSDKEDFANLGESHGDRVIADALAYHACEDLNGGPKLAEKQVKKGPPTIDSKNPPPGSIASRIQANRKKDKAASASGKAWTSFAGKSASDHNYSRGSFRSFY